MEEMNQNSCVDNKSTEPSQPSSSSFSVQYLGSMPIHPLYSQTLQPWVMAEIYRTKKCSRDVILDVDEDTIFVHSVDKSLDKKLPLSEHNLKDVSQFAKLHNDPKCFAYLVQQQAGSDVVCHVYRAGSEDMAPQILKTLQGASKSIISKSVSVETSSQSSMDSNSQITDGEIGTSSKSLFEVKYLGKAKVSQKKVTSDDIDSLAEKMLAQLQVDETRRGSLSREGSVQSTRFSIEADLNSGNNDATLADRLKRSSSKYDTASALASVTVAQVLCDVAIQTLSNPVPIETENSEQIRDKSNSVNINRETEKFLRKGSLINLSEVNSDFVKKNSRSLSLKDSRYLSSSLSRLDSPLLLEKFSAGKQEFNFQKSVDGENRKQEAGQVMVLQIGLQKITLISLDKKMAILECKFKDISSVSQGSQKQDMFGVVARESEYSFSCYILRCLSGSMVVDIMSTLQREFASAYKDRGMSSTGAVIAASTLTQQQVCSSCPLLQLHRICQEINTMTSQVANDLLMKKVQLLPDNELSELNTFIQAEQPKSIEESVEVIMIFLLQLSRNKQKKHSHVLQTAVSNVKRNIGGFRNVSWTTDSDTNSWTSGDSSATTTPETSPMSREFHHSYPSPPSSPIRVRKRSATIDSVGSINRAGFFQAKKREASNKPVSAGKNVSHSVDNTPKHSVNLFSSAGNSPQKDVASLPSSKPNSSWRKAIYNSVCTPQHSSDYEDDSALGQLHNREEIRATWKKAILETLLLIRLEKEKHNIQARQEDEESTLSCKLDYQELTPCLKEITSVWNKMLSEQRKFEEERDESNIVNTLGKAKLVECVKKGVPRNLRGQIWQFLMQQQQGVRALSDITSSTTNYQDLLKQLTTHQHAILIDLGRTFPSHPYFSTSLGAGQLELFNLLKVYSLLDAEVGYCQGLSFIVGMLLMHMEEISAFHVLKYIMYDLGLRQQFRPDMMALQVKLYQLTRLLHDHYKDVYDHFERHEISPSLYAAPWFLTLFASQFPLGFVARVFDMIFVQGISALLKVALMLIGNHRALILQCDSFETVVDFLKITLPEMVQVQMERIINQAFELDIERELHAYEVEYHVLSEEINFSTTSQLLRQHQQRSDQQGRVPTSSKAAENANRRMERRRRMSIDHEMLYRLESHNRALKNQNLDLLEKLKQAQSQRDSCEHSILAHQDERDKLRSHIQALELERAALLAAVAKLQALVPPDTIHGLNVPNSPSNPSVRSSASTKGCDTASEEINRTNINQGGDDSSADETIGNSKTQQQNYTFTRKDTEVKYRNVFERNHLQNHKDSVPFQPSPTTDVDLTANTSLKSTHHGNTTSDIDILLNSSAIGSSSSPNPVKSTDQSILNNVDEELTSNDHQISEINSQTEPNTICKKNNITNSEITLENTAETTPRLSSLTLLSLAESHEPEQKQQKIETIPAQIVSQVDLRALTNVTTSRQNYATRSISNVSSNYSSTEGSVTPEERRKSVKVVVQQSSSTKQTHLDPSSQK